MSEIRDLVRAFHAKYHPDDHVEATPETVPAELRAFRRRLFAEEAQEVSDAIEAGDVAGEIHELGDVMIVAAGTITLHGLDPMDVIRVIMAANMRKVPNPVPGGKALKPVGFVSAAAEIQAMVNARDADCARRARRAPAAPVRTARKADEQALSKAQTRILTALAQHGEGTRRRVALLAGYSGKGGCNNQLSGLAAAGLIRTVQEGDEERLVITEAGQDAISPWEPLPTGPALRAWWAGRLKPLQVLLLDTMLDAHPDVVSLTGLATAAGVSGRGGFNNQMRNLFDQGLITFGKPGADESPSVLLDPVLARTIKGAPRR